MSYDIDKFGKKSGIELNNLNAGMKKTDIDEKNTAGKSIFDAIDTDGNGIIDENEIKVFRSEIDDNENNTISKKEAEKYLEEKGLNDIDKKEILKFLAEMIDQTKDVKEVKILTENGQKVVQTLYQDGTIILINADKSYSRISTDENGSQIIEEYDNANKLTRKTTTDTKTKIITEYGDDGKTVEKEISTDSATGEVVTTNYSEGKPVSKDVEKGTVLTHYEVDAYGNMQKKSMIVNKGDLEKQRVTTYETNPDGTVTETTTDALAPGRRSIRTVSPETGESTLTKEVIQEENGYIEIITTENDRTETEYNSENYRTRQTKTVDGQEYTVEYDGKGNTKVVLQNGESIEVLAKRFGTTKEKILEANDGKIRGWAGDSVVIPGELEADDSRLQGRQTAEEAKSAYKVVAAEIEEVNEEAKSRKKIIFTEKVHNTWEELARGLFKAEGVENPTKRQLKKRIEQLKEANPEIKDGELKGKRITAPVAEEVHERIAAKETKRKQEAAEKQKVEENKKLQIESAKQIADELIKATKGYNDEKAIKNALANG